MGGWVWGKVGGSHQQMERPRGLLRMDGEKSSAPRRHAPPPREAPPPPPDVITVTLQRVASPTANSLRLDHSGPTPPAHRTNPRPTPLAATRADRWLTLPLITATITLSRASGKERGDRKSYKTLKLALGEQEVLIHLVPSLQLRSLYTVVTESVLWVFFFLKCFLTN